MDRSTILNSAEREANATVGQATVDGYEGMKSASAEKQKGEMAKQIGSTAFSLGKMALSGPTGGASNFIPNPFSFM